MMLIGLTVLTLCAVATGVRADTWTCRLLSVDTFVVQGDWGERRAAVWRQETWDGRWALESVGLGGKDEEWSDVKLLNAEGIVIWENRLKGALLSPRGPVFATGNVYGGGVAVYNLRLSDTALYRNVPFGGYPKLSADGTTFGVRGAGSFLLISDAGEELGCPAVGIQSYHLGAISDSGRHFAIYAKDERDDAGYQTPTHVGDGEKGADPRSVRDVDIRHSYSVRVFSRTGALMAEVGPFRTPRAVAFGKGDPDRFAVVTDFEVSIWSMKGALLWWDGSLSPERNSVAGIAHMTDSGCLFVIGQQFAGGNRPLLWSWDGNGTRLAYRVPVPAAARRHGHVSCFRVDGDSLLTLVAESAHIVLSLSKETK